MSDKFYAFTLLPLGVILTIISLFVFATGWDKLKSYLDSGSINGRVELSLLNSPFLISPQVHMLELDGKKYAEATVNSEGAFEFIEITPGDYQLEFNGKGIKPVKKSASVFPRRSTEAGSVQLQFDVLTLGVKEKLPHFRYVQAHKSYGGDVWVSGFRIKDNQSEYKVFTKDRGQVLFGGFLLRFGDGQSATNRI